MHHEHGMPLLLLTLSGIISLALVFVACELGQRMGDAFEEIDYTIEQLDWYLFPMEIQRMLPMIIAIAQPPVLLECWGNIACTRDVFKHVCIKLFNHKTTIMLIF